MNIGVPGYTRPLARVEDAGGGLDLRGLWSIALRRLPLIAGAFGVIATLVLAITLLQPAKYTATASIMINPRQEQVISRDQTLSNVAPNSAVVDSEIEVLRSPRLAALTAQALRLDADPAWNPALRGASPIGQIMRPILDALRPARPTAPGQSTVAAAIAGKLAGAIDVRRRALSYVIDISAEAPTAAQAARIANTLVEMYFRTSDEARVETGARASGWLGQRLAELRRDVKSKEEAAEAYRAQTGLLTSEGQSLTERQMTDVQSTVMMAQADLAEKEARYRQVQTLVNAGGSVDTIGSVLNSQVVRDLRNQETELTRRQAELENDLGPLHPAVINGRTELENVRSQIAAEVRRIADSLRNDVEVSRSRLQTLQSSLGSVRGQLQGNNVAQVRLNELEREAAASRAVYESFLQRYHEISGQGQLADAEARIVSDAQAPRAPSSPRPLLGVLAALLAGAAGAVILAFGAEALDDTMISADDVEERVGAPALTSIPTVPVSAMRLLPPSDRHPAGYLVEKPMSAFAEAFRVLRTSILYADLDKRTKVVAITSALPEEGKTTCSLSLARIAALSGQSVVIVDCDLRRRSLNKLLEIEPQAGLLQVLAGEQVWQSVTGQDEATTAHILPLADSPFTPRDVFGSNAMTRLIAELKAAYDLVILDCAPVLAVADTRVLVGQADCVVLIARSGKTSTRATASAVRQLRPTQAHIIGVALNCVNPRMPGRASYSDALYYHNAAKNYYTA